MRHISTNNTAPAVTPFARISRSLVSFVGAVGLTLSLGLAAPVAAEAAGGARVSGTVTCMNSFVVGIWVQGESSNSGWASWKVPMRLGGHSQADYSFILNRGGRYKVHVGCGGTSKNWRTNLPSGWVGGTKNNFKCNDILRNGCRRV